MRMLGGRDVINLGVAAFGNFEMLLLEGETGFAGFHKPSASMRVR
jgi:hypothetical protein